MDLKPFYKTFFKKQSVRSESETYEFLGTLKVRKLSKGHRCLCERGITKKDLCNSLKGMHNNKSLGNDGLTKEFYENFWNHIKETYFNSIRGTKLQNLLTISQRLAIIKSIVKKDRNKRLIKNWRLISLLNVDIKILSKALLQKLKENLPSLIILGSSSLYEK